MNRLIKLRLGSLLIAIGVTHVHAEQARINRGHDPFFQISKAIAACPTPLGPLETQKEWLDDSHYRIERGNSCWIEGRCRLPNAYLYDAEIAEAVGRRLASVNVTTHWREQSTLWLTLQRRFIYVEGCVAPGFDKHAFLAELAKTADVERVIDNTTTDPHAARLPYRTLADPDKPVLDPGNERVRQAVPTDTPWLDDTPRSGHDSAAKPLSAIVHSNAGIDLFGPGRRGY